MGKSNSKGFFVPCVSAKQTIKLEKEKEIVINKENINSKLLKSQNKTIRISQNSKENHSTKVKLSTIKEPSINSNDFKNMNENFEEVIDLFSLETIENDSPNLSNKLSKFPPTSKYNNSLRNFSNVSTGNSSQVSSNHNSPKRNNLESFQMIKVIGKGTFGKVILVKEKLTNSIFAIKSIKKLHILKTKNLENLKNEKKILKQIEHPFIISLKDTFQDIEKIYFVFDYYNGGELFFHLQRLRKFDENFVRFYSCQIYLALIHLHQNGIIYRDLKPENIVLDAAGNIKLIDFGLAKDDINLDSRCNTFCGTNEYIPPEVIKGNKYNFNFDWWGFGVILYELLFGVPPFVEKSGNKNILFRKICILDPDLNKNNVTLSNEATDLLKSLLNKNPDMRIKPEDIPKHPFYSMINFDDVINKKIKPPFIPKIKNAEDVSNFDPTFLKEELLSPVKKLKYEIDQSKFSDF